MSSEPGAGHCVSFGEFSTLLRQLNGDAKWREIFGKPSNRLKDEELILRFFAALLHNGKNYTKPMRGFLDDFLESNRSLQIIKRSRLSNEFESTISLARKALSAKAFRTGSSLNAAIFDSVMVGIARRLQK